MVLMKFFLSSVLLLWASVSFADQLGRSGDPFGNSLTGTSDPFTAAAQDDFLPVEKAYQSLLAWDEDTLLIEWSIADGYYLYQQRFAVSAQIDGEALPTQTAFEPGKVKDDPFFGTTEVYYFNTALAVTGLPKDAPFILSIRSQGCADAGLCYPPQTQRYQYQPTSQDFTLLTDTPASNQAPAPTTTVGFSEDPGPSSLPFVILLALLGGAILNLMPCVFPVLSLKVLSFANAHHGQTASHGAVYGLGVVVSFVAVAGLLIVLQQAGQAVGWGFQLQQPGFVAAMATLFFLMSLNLLGVFEFAGRWMNAGSGLSQQGNYSGSFFTGVLATLVASPCTAPFMGSALGYAASQPPATALLVFASLGMGMALPVMILSLFPAWLRYLPKPGMWMERLRQFLSFPLLASAIWLLWVYGRQLGANSMATLLLAWLLIGLAIWLWKLRGSARLLGVISALCAGYLAWQGGQASPQPSQSTTAFDPASIRELRASGQNVFLDVTADWCITCAANERLVLNTDEIQQAFARNNTHYLVADWTRYDPAITALLADFQRNGIPLYVYYPSDLNAAPAILPQILTKAVVLKLWQD